MSIGLLIVNPLLQQYKVLVHMVYLKKFCFLS